MLSQPVKTLLFGFAFVALMPALPATAQDSEETEADQELVPQCGENTRPSEILRSNYKMDAGPAVVIVVKPSGTKKISYGNVFSGAASIQAAGFAPPVFVLETQSDVFSSFSVRFEDFSLGKAAEVDWDRFYKDSRIKIASPEDIRLALNCDELPAFLENGFGTATIKRHGGFTVDVWMNLTYAPEFNSFHGGMVMKGTTTDGISVTYNVPVHIE